MKSPRVIKNATENENAYKEFSYDELVEIVEHMQISIQKRLNRFNVITYLISYNNIVLRNDYDNIIRLYVNGIIDN